jgi:hypothetical protein
MGGEGCDCLLRFSSVEVRKNLQRLGRFTDSRRRIRRGALPFFPSRSRNQGTWKSVVSIAIP